jgi:hypothetical protein
MERPSEQTRLTAFHHGVHGEREERQRLLTTTDTTRSKSENRTETNGDSRFCFSPRSPCLPWLECLHLPLPKISVTLSFTNIPALRRVDAGRFPSPFSRGSIFFVDIGEAKS